MLSETDILALLPPPIAERAKSASFDDGVVTLVLDAGGLNVADRAGLEKAAQTVLNEHAHIADTRVAMMSDKVKRRIVAIASGKGGVGKSTLTANLAVALKAAGHKVGVVDADVYGPSQPTLLNSKDAKPKAHNEQLIPVAGHSDIPMLSMGHLVDPDKALAWRGPMAAGALTQLMEADWGETELLLLDLPPGTGDVQLTMVQKFRPDGAVIVSTPQDLALIDAKRAMQLFAQVQVPIIGLVENMSGYVCPHCGEASDPFGAGGVEHAAQAMGADFLGRIPLALGIREASDTGSPSVEHADFAPHYTAIAEQVQAWLTQEQG